MPVPAELPLTKHFGEPLIAEIDIYCKDRLKSMVQGLKQIREEKIQRWRKVYMGEPREKTKSFPWQNASNVVIQLVGSYVDQLTAKIVMATIGTDPLWTAGLLGEFKREENAEEQRQQVEEWLSYSGMEPSHLNLLTKYVIWIRTFVRYGLGSIKLLPELTVDQVAGTLDDKGQVTFTEHTRHNGPVAHPLMFEDFLIPATVQELERYPIVAQRSIMQRYQIEALKFDKSFDQKGIDTILSRPDRQGPDKNQREIEDETGARSDAGGPNSEEWDFYEAYFPFSTGGKRFHIIETYHLQSETPLKRVFNWLPDNSIPFVTARLGSDGERSHGFGFCEMLRDYQEEVSAIHNRRGDASTLSNTNLIRAGDGTQLDTNFAIFPNALVTGPEGSIEVIPLGRNANETIKDEQQTLQLATDRAGVGPSSSGAGAGTVSKKGQYSAMGAFPVIQEGNTRANLNITEFRTSHYTLGRLKLLYDAHFGVPERDLKAFGENRKYLEKAMTNIRDGRIILPIRAATGSVNKEIEKQNLMLLLNNLRAHGQLMSQLLGQLQNPMVAGDPALAHFILSFASTSTFVMKYITREFGVPDPSAAVPEMLGINERLTMIEKAFEQQKMQAQRQQPQQPQLPQGGAPPQNVSPEQQPQAVQPQPVGGNGAPPQ